MPRKTANWRKSAIRKPDQKDISSRYSFNSDQLPTSLQSEIKYARKLVRIRYSNVSFLEDDEREEAILSGGLDLIVVPGLGFTKVSLCDYERICSDSLQLLFRCYYYFAPTVFVVQCISESYQEQNLVV